MKTRIRAITVGVDFTQHNLTHLSDYLQTFFLKAETNYQTAGFEVQTRRLTIPPMQPIDLPSFYKIKSIVDTCNRISNDIKARWICLPITGRAAWPIEWIRLLTNIVAVYPKIFLHFMITENGYISNSLSVAAAQTILALSQLSTNGYDNFRVGVGANIPSNTPYFPFSYHQGDTGFSLAIELTELIYQTVKTAGSASLLEIRDQLINAISPLVAKIDDLGQQLEIKTGFAYKGQDISIAPFPGEFRSIALIIEMLGPLHCGQSGTLMVTSLLTDVLKTVIQRTKIRHTGFNGVMFSLLEDSHLAKANNQRHLSLEKLMLYSAVCGCGIDMVPVPGDILDEELVNLFLDVAALSTVLKKPLGVRVLPIPLKKTNELTNFNHDFLTNTRIMQLESHRLSLPLSEKNTLNYLRFETR